MSMASLVELVLESYLGFGAMMYGFGFKYGYMGCSICSPSAVVCLRKCLCSTCLLFDDRTWFGSRTCTLMCHYWSEAYYNAHFDAKTCMTISLDLSEAYYSVGPDTKIYTTWCHDWWKARCRAGVALNLLKDMWFSSLHGESRAPDVKSEEITNPLKCATSKWGACECCRLPPQNSDLFQTTMCQSSQEVMRMQRGKNISSGVVDAERKEHQLNRRIQALTE